MCFGTKLELNLKITLFLEFKITLNILKLKIIILKCTVLVTIGIDCEYSLLNFECSILNLGPII